jgi:AraC family transcriptional regulator
VGATTLQPGVFLGRTVRTDRVGGFTLVESVPEYRRQPLHEHANHYVYVALGGSFDGVVGASQRSLAGRAMTVSYLPAGEPHANLWYGVDRRCLNIEITADRARQLAAVCPLPQCPVAVETPAAAAVARHLAREFATDGGMHPFSLEGLVLELLAELTRTSHSGRDGPDPPRWLVQVRDRLKAAQEEIPSLDELAAEVGVHPSHLSRVFRQCFGLTPGSYVRRERVARACRLITAHERMPLVRIAATAGFADQSHMTREFRHWLGVCPSAYRSGERAAIR